MKNEKLGYTQARAIDLVDYLATLGHFPVKIKKPDYWYLSPLREEKNPSFKVNQKRNIWFDHGIGKGGNVIEFGKLFFDCSMEEFLARLVDLPGTSFSFHNQCPDIQPSTPTDSQPIQITDSRLIADPDLRAYLQQRSIPLLIANRFCSEIEFQLSGKRYLVIGFKNDRGGYELRSGKFKASNAPKSPTHIKNSSEHLSVFEGFFDFLSFQTQLLYNMERVCELSENQDSYLILNSLAYLEKSKEVIEGYKRVNLYLDTDLAGVKSTQKILDWTGNYQDKSLKYGSCKDLNEYLCRQNRVIGRQL
jgi:hypothetical protein